MLAAGFRSWNCAVEDPKRQELQVPDTRKLLLEGSWDLVARTIMVQGFRVSSLLVKTKKVTMHITTFSPN